MGQNLLQQTICQNIGKYSVKGPFCNPNMIWGDEGMDHKMDL